MWQYSARKRVREELSHLIPYWKSYFGDDLEQIVVFGSFLSWRFRRDSDIDVALILRDTPKWRWSRSSSYWDMQMSPQRERFSQSFAEFQKASGITRIYDLKLVTRLDLTLIEHFQTNVVKSGRVAIGIRKGHVIYERSMARGHC